MLIIFLFALILSTILIILNSLIALKSQKDREKPSPFECGFDPKSYARLPFSIRFYLIAVIFLVFDVEITLILPIPIALMENSEMFVILLTSFFVFILIFGLYAEWANGALQWS
uniref:NADH dehydrogenase subunit 3 n=1 Tax=Spinactaletes boneti TaxID=2736147 RepID=UPI001EDE7C7E|nr:NADH dehydrogenase subunit 3 [Spinactaletes boneti]UJY98022.1 NADH dehydrogenase subunit 3 [Spinactaletes boneti]